MNEREELTEQQIEAVRIEMGTGVHPSLFLRIARAVEAQVYAALASAPAGEPECSTPTFREAVGGLVYTAHAVVQCPRSVAQRAALERYADLVAGMLADMAAPPASPPPQATAPADHSDHQAQVAERPDEAQLERWRAVADDLLRADFRASSPLIRDAALQLQNAYLSWRLVPPPEQEATPAPAGAMEDAERLDWLETMTVNVRQPLRYGSHNLFWASPEDVDGGPSGPSDIRRQIDAARQAGKGGAEC